LFRQNSAVQKGWRLAASYWKLEEKTRSFANISKGSIHRHTRLNSINPQKSFSSDIPLFHCSAIVI